MRSVTETLQDQLKEIAMATSKTAQISNTKNSGRPQVISLFCGAGGLDLGFAQAGFDVVLAADYDDAAITTHNENLTSKVAVKIDLLKATAKDLQKHIPNTAVPVGIIGGPPCQGFSQANTQRASDDPRNNLAKNYTKMIIGLTKIYPIDFFVFENVAGLLSSKNSSVLDSLKATLSQEFHVFSKLLNAKDYGVPQSRERFFMIGLRKNGKSSKREFDFPKPTTQDPLTVRQAIGHLPAATFFQRDLTPENIEHHPNHWTMRPRSKRFGPDLVTNGRSLIRLDWEKPSRTVAYGHREIHVHPSGLRRLTIYEAMLLQGFPENYKLSGTLSNQVTQVSNAVPPPLAKILGTTLLNKINIPVNAPKEKK